MAGPSWRSGRPAGPDRRQPARAEVEDRSNSVPDPAQCRIPAQCQIEKASAAASIAMSAILIHRRLRAGSGRLTADHRFQIQIRPPIRSARAVRRWPQRMRSRPEQQPPEGRGARSLPLLPTGSPDECAATGSSRRRGRPPGPATIRPAEEPRAAAEPGSSTTGRRSTTQRRPRRRVRFANSSHPPCHSTRRRTAMQRRPPGGAPARAPAPAPAPAGAPHDQERPTGVSIGDRDQVSARIRPRMASATADGYVSGSQWPASASMNR